MPKFAIDDHDIAIGNNNNNNNDIDKRMKKKKKKKSRRLLQSTYNNGENYIEMKILCDPYLRQEFVDSYGSSGYYDELLAYTMDYVNRMTNIYGTTDWGNDIGNLNIIFREFVVFSSFSGNYGGLQFTTSSDGTGDIADYRDKLIDYVVSYEDINDIDHFQIWTGHSMDAYGIVPDIGTVCNNPSESVSINWKGSTDARFLKTIAHELGHCLGMWHDFVKFYLLFCCFFFVFGLDKFC